ncbi:MAG: hypothetical protein R3F14_07935 [Polyangiaceae bacterium]
MKVSTEFCWTTATAGFAAAGEGDGLGGGDDEDFYGAGGALQLPLARRSTALAWMVPEPSARMRARGLSGQQAGERAARGGHGEEGCQEGAAGHHREIPLVLLEEECLAGGERLLAVDVEGDEAMGEPPEGRPGQRARLAFLPGVRVPYFAAMPRASAGRG